MQLGMCQHLALVCLCKSTWLCLFYVPVFITEKQKNPFPREMKRDSVGLCCPVNYLGETLCTRLVWLPITIPRGGAEGRRKGELASLG